MDLKVSVVEFLGGQYLPRLMVTDPTGAVNNKSGATIEATLRRHKNLRLVKKYHCAHEVGCYYPY